MISYVNGEVIIFLWSLLAGAVIMLTYDFFSSFTTNRNLSLFVLNVFDGIFVICAVTLMIFILLNVSNGYIRGFEFVGALIGGALYKITLSPIFKLLFTRTIAIFFGIFHLFCKLLLTPIRFTYKIICNIIGVLSKIASKCLMPFFRKLSLFKIALKKT